MILARCYRLPCRLHMDTNMGTFAQFILNLFFNSCSNIMRTSQCDIAIKLEMHLNRAICANAPRGKTMKSYHSWRLSQYFFDSVLFLLGQGFFHKFVDSRLHQGNGHPHDK